MAEEAQPAMEVASEPSFSPEMLKIYYSRLMPHDLLFRWLSYGNDPTSSAPGIQRDFFHRREISMTLENDIYIRYQCFRDGAEMAAAIQRRNPHKIDIGAVFSALPKDHNTLQPEAFRTVERELVFDIDMTDYDDVRFCCSGAKICPRCWPYMTMAVHVMNACLREDFGYEHLAWVYSGRRGVHCWVSDSAARALPNDARMAIVDYLLVVNASENNSKSVSLASPVHPMIRRAYDILEPLFVRHVAAEDGQGLLADEQRWTKALKSMPNDDLRRELLERWSRDGSSAAEKWQQLLQRTSPPERDATAPQKRHKKLNYVALELWRMELVLHFCYPRLDANVSKHQNHLLKSPFCVHPKTGRVCVPFNGDAPDDFDPFAVPTLATLCRQLDEHNDEDVPDLAKTDLRPYVDDFERRFMQPLGGALRREFRDLAEQEAASMVDF